MGRPVGVFIVFEDDSGAKAEAHIPNALMTQVTVESGVARYEFLTTGEWQITKFNTHKKFNHVKGIA